VTRILLIAAGEGTRWGNHLGVPKHLAPLLGTTVLGRLVDQFSPHGEVIVVGPDDDRYRLAELYVPNVRPYDADKFLSSRSRWGQDRTLVVYGDLYLSEEAVATLAAPTARLTFYGRWSGSKLTGTRWGELFGVSFMPHDQRRLIDALTTVERWQRDGVIDRSGGWETFHRLNGAGRDTVRRHLPVHRRGPCRFVEIDDWSDDFDFAEDYNRWIRRRQRANLPV
jgi:hypothetical protein